MKKRKKPAIIISIKNRQKKININKQEIISVAKQVLLIKGKQRAELSILLTGKRRIRSLNKKFRKIDRVTDVLSFSQFDPEIIGDVVICPEIAKQQLKLCLIHGILHLLGSDDATKKNRLDMEQEQAQILTRLQ
ncbi:MAG: rRNA maturation RNase YbeY [Candidatus Omnitrophica bacterium]|nr:rRNA maturation RNase YbeY [Candidatus Omnitrophota bacterium]